MPAYFSAFLIALLVLSPLPVRAAEPTQITVTGTGSVSLPPDEAIVNAAVQTNSDAAAEAVSDNSAIYERVASALGSIGIPRANVTLSGYNVEYTRRPVNGGSADEEYGYTVTRRFTVTTSDLSLVGKIVDAATSAGATDINDVSFGLADTVTPGRDALARAVQDATARAQALAADAHLHIIGIASIEQSAGYFGPVTAVIAHATRTSTPTTFDNGNTTVTQTVTMVFLAKP